MGLTIFQRNAPVSPGNSIGSYPRTDSTQTHTAIASEPISAPAIVHVFSDSTGQAKVRNANAAFQNRPARGFILTPVSPGGVATIYLPGSVIAGFQGLIPGADYFLASVPGGITTTPPSSPGSSSQYVGTAINPTTITFSPTTPTLL